MFLRVLLIIPVVLFITGCQFVKRPIDSHIVMSESVERPAPAQKADKIIYEEPLIMEHLPEIAKASHEEPQIALQDDDVELMPGKAIAEKAHEASPIQQHIPAVAYERALALSKESQENMDEFVKAQNNQDGQHVVNHKKEPVKNKPTTLTLSPQQKRVLELSKKSSRLIQEYEEKRPERNALVKKVSENQNIGMQP